MNTIKRLALLLALTLIPTLANAQSCHYQYLETISSNSEDVTFKLKVFCETKKDVENAARLAALRCVIFEGIPDTRFKTALIPEGEATSIANHKDYYNSLYSRRYDDFIKDSTMISKFKKSGDRKSTIFEVTVHASRIRKDLEKNNIKTKLGL